MTSVIALTMNPFQENTYLVFDADKNALLIDPGCHTADEENSLADKISEMGLSINMVINTHCHLDHVFGNKWAVDRYNCPFLIPEGELDYLSRSTSIATSYGFFCKPSPTPTGFLVAGESVPLGDQSFMLLSTPGHSPDSMCLYHREDGFVIAGDVLFRESIGRTDLPGGDYNTLVHSIQTQLYALPNETVIYPGHGPSTTIGHEKEFNPFVSV
ncbi:MAG: MBL fold metallo-hydrolase [Saprospiraceae bacterium]|nr:MBL fold metallo-hydrolase [Saprospiraceae bacterium]